MRPVIRAIMESKEQNKKTLMLLANRVKRDKKNYQKTIIDKIRLKGGKLTKEDQEIQELSKRTLAGYIDKSHTNAMKNVKSYNDLGNYYQANSGLGTKYKRKIRNRNLGIKRATDRIATEEQDIQELSKKTLGSYAKKAIQDVGDYTSASDQNDPYFFDNADEKLGTFYGRKASNRKRGLERSINRLTKEEQEVNELSKKTLGSYIKKASNNVGVKSSNSGYLLGYSSALSNLGIKGDKLSFKDKTRDKISKNLKLKAYKRLRGIETATNKLTKEEQEIQELSKKTLGRYIKKASRNLSTWDSERSYLGGSLNNPENLHGKNVDAVRKNIYKKIHNSERKSANRDTGIRKATDRLTKEELDLYTNKYYHHFKD